MLSLAPYRCQGTGLEASPAGEALEQAKVPSQGLLPMPWLGLTCPMQWPKASALTAKAGPGVSQHLASQWACECVLSALTKWPVLCRLCTPFHLGAWPIQGQEAQGKQPGRYKVIHFPLSQAETPGDQRLQGAMWGGGPKFLRER